MQDGATTVIEVPVLIVGGGGCGLALTVFLQNLGVSSLTIERNPTTADLPRAHILNQRTLEIFAQHGLADAVYAEGSSLEAMAKIRFMTSLGGDGPFDRRVIGELDGYGGGALRERYEADCAYRATNLPQIQLEPLLRRIAEARAPRAIRFHHELVRLEQDSAGVTAWIRDHAHDREYEVRARYLVAADGGKTVGRLLDIPVDGPRKLRRMVNAYFSADLSPWVDDDQVLLFYFISPDAVGIWGGGGLLKAGPTRWDRHSESWVFMRELHPDDPEELDEANVLQRIRELLRLPDSPITLHKMGGWEVQGVAARHLRVGRVLLAGDAAHRHPPVSALGLNTGFADAHNLAWKLAYVMSGHGGDALLDSYHEERQPVGARVAEWALNGFRVRSLIDVAIGIEPGNRAATAAAFEALFAETPGGATRRAILDEVMRIQRIGPQAHDMEIGYRYDRGALVPDGRARPERDPMASAYRPSTSPGCRLPHAWLERDSRRVSTHDLVPRDGFALFVGSKGEAWTRAAAAVAASSGVRIDAIVIDARNGWTDAEGAWSRLREVGEEGAVLVRPDAHVGWRAFEQPADTVVALVAAVRSVLGQA